MSNLEIVKREMFAETECDFYRNDSNELFMTSEQLGKALGYADPRKSVSKLVERNTYLDNMEFSSTVNLTSEGKTRLTRIFTEDGIYEVTMLSKTDKAFEFRSWVRKILKGLRSGEIFLQRRDSYMIQDPIERARRWAEEQEEHQILINSKNVEIHELQEKSGFNSLQVASAIKELKRRISVLTNKEYIWSSQSNYIIAKAKVFEYFKVQTWEGIPGYKFADCISFINQLNL